MQIFFAKLLQCNSTFKIAMYHNCKTKNNILFSQLFSLILTLTSSLCLSQVTAPPSSFPLSHLSPSNLTPVLSFGFWRLDRHGSTCWVWISGLGSVDGGFGSVDQWVWINGFINQWVDRLGWLSVAPMVAPVVIFLEWVCCGGVALVLVWFWFWFLFSHLPSLTL